MDKKQIVQDEVDEYGVQVVKVMKKTEVDEYGVEEVEMKSPAEPKYVTKPKLSPVKKEEVKKEPKQAPIELDEEDMYEEQPKVMDKIAEAPVMEALLKKKTDLEVEDALVIFRGEQFFLYDFKASSGWAYGDLVIQGIEENQTFKADKEDKVSNEIEELYNKLSGEMGLFMPNIQSAIVTKDFMQAVEQGKCWLPSKNQVNLLPAALPPKINKLKKQVVDKAKTQGFSQESIDSFKLFASYLDKSTADLSWLLGIHALFEPNAEIFQQPTP